MAIYNEVGGEALIPQTGYPVDQGFTPLYLVDIH